MLTPFDVYNSIEMDTKRSTGNKYRFNTGLQLGNFINQGAGP